MVKNKINQVRATNLVQEIGHAPDPVLYDDLKQTMVAMVKKSVSSRYVKNIKLTPESDRIMCRDAKTDFAGWRRI